MADVWQLFDAWFRRMYGLDVPASTISSTAAAAIAASSSTKAAGRPVLVLPGLHAVGDDEPALKIDMHAVGDDEPALKIDMHAVGATPRGWLAAVLAHGGQSLAFSMAYMLGERYTSHRTLLPTLGSMRDHAGRTEDNDLDWGRDVSLSDNEKLGKPSTDLLLLEKYGEPPCPVFPRCAPFFLIPHNMYSSAYLEYRDVYNSRRSLNGGVGPEWDRACAFTDASKIQWGWGSERFMLLSALREKRIGVDDDGYLVYQFDTDGEKRWFEVRPARRVAGWLEELAHDHIGAGRWGWAEASDLFDAEWAGSKGNIDRAVRVPKRWRSANRLPVYVERLGLWYRSAQVLVWDMECMREHHPKMRAKSAPSWWLAHCTMWGIGVRAVTGLEKSYRHVMSDDEPQLETKFDEKQVLAMMRLVVQHTPPPGAAGWTGEQIAEPHNDGEQVRHRTLCDFPRGNVDLSDPESVGSLAPVVDLVDDGGSQYWVKLALYRWAKKQDDWVVEIAPYMNALISIVASYASAATSAIEGVITDAVVGEMAHVAVSLSLQCVMKLGRGELSVDAGDVIGLFGDVLSVSGVADGIGSQLPAGFWDAMKRAGAAIPDVTGADMDIVRGGYEKIQRTMVAIRDGVGWDYLDEGFGALGLTDAARDMFDGRPSSLSVNK